MVTSRFTTWPIVALLVAAVPASAQVAEPQPPAPATAQQYRGLFLGGDEAAPGLGLVLSATGGYDTNLLAERGGGNSRLGQGVAGEFTEGRGQLTYLTTRRETTFSLVGSSSLRYYPGFESSATYSHSATAALSFGIGRRFDVALTQGAFYSSFYQLMAVPGVSANAAPVVPGTPVVSTLPRIDSQVAGQEMFGYDSGVELTQTLGSRDSVRYHYMRRQYETGFAQRQLLTQGGGATYRRVMTRYGALRLGYAYQEADYDRQLAGTTRIHNLDTGYDYSRPLSFSRRTTVGFTTGMQVFDREQTTFYHALLGANVAHQIGRTWGLDVVYGRGAQFVDVLDQPIYTDALGVHADGFVAGSRLHLSLDARFSTGNLSTTANQNQLVTYRGSTQLEWGLSERWALHGSYTFYSYDFGQTIVLPAGLDSQVERHSVMGGLRVFLPLTSQRGHRGTR